MRQVQRRAPGRAGPARGRGPGRWSAAGGCARPRAPRPPRRHAAAPRRRRPVRTDDDVAAVVHAVGEVDVEVAGRPEHHRVAAGAAAVGVGAGVARSVVRLDLGDPDRDGPVVGVPRAPRRAAAARRRGRRRSAPQASQATVLRGDLRGARRAARRTRTGAVPPRPSREATEPSTVSTSRTAGVSAGVDRGELARRSARRARRRAPRSGGRRHRRPRAPPGTARPRGPATRRRRWPARSPAGASSAIRSVSKVSVATMPVKAGSSTSRVSTRVEDRLLVLLQVAVVGERQALERGQQPGEVADQPAGLAAGQLGDVGVLLLRHDARPGGVGVVRASRSRTPWWPRG